MVTKCNIFPAIRAARGAKIPIVILWALRMAQDGRKVPGWCVSTTGHENRATGRPEPQSKSAKKNRPRQRAVFVYVGSCVAVCPVYRIRAMI